MNLMNLYRAGAKIDKYDMVRVEPCDLCGVQFVWPEYQEFTVCQSCWNSK